MYVQFQQSVNNLLSNCDNGWAIGLSIAPVMWSFPGAFCGSIFFIINSISVASKGTSSGLIFYISTICSFIYQHIYISNINYLFFHILAEYYYLLGNKAIIKQHKTACKLTGKLFSDTLVFFKKTASQFGMHACKNGIGGLILCLYVKL